MYNKAFHTNKQDLKSLSSLPGSRCSFEMSMFVVSEGKKRRRDVGMLS